MGLHSGQLLSALAVNSIAQRCGRAVGVPGALVDQLVVSERIRTEFLERENQRLLRLLEICAVRMPVPALSPAILNARYEDAEGYLIAKRTQARRLTRPLLPSRQVSRPDWIRAGYHGVVGRNVLVVSMASDLLRTDIFAAGEAYFVAPGAIEHWSRTIKDRVQFSVDIVEGARVEKLVVQRRT